MKLSVLLFTVLFMLFGCGQRFHVITASSPGISTQTLTTAAIPKHVLSVIYGYGYGGVSRNVPISAQSPYVDWAYTDEADASAYRSAGIKTLIYLNFWRNYSTDNPSIGYTDLKPGGAHAAAEAKGCTGTPSYDSNYGGGYLADPRKTTPTLGHARVVEQYRANEYGNAYNAFFSDDTDGNGGVNPAPCNYTFASWLAATNTIDMELNVPMFVNALNAWTTGGSPTLQVPVVNPPNVLGAMCEACYVSNGGVVSGNSWMNEENAEIGVINDRKIFWEYARNVGAASSSQALRLYGYASFLLTYDPSYAMYETAFYTPSNFPIMPEQGLVPMEPVNTSASVSGYMTGSVAERRFAQCYYRGQSIGSCAVAINIGSTTAPVPVQYPASMVLVGGGVQEGGQANFTGPMVSFLQPHTAAILVGTAATPVPTPTLAPTPVPTVAPTLAPTATPAPITYGFVKNGQLAGINGSQYTYQFGSGCGYLHVYKTSSTILSPTGYLPKVGDTDTIYGSGSCSSGSVTAAKIVKD